MLAVRLIYLTLAVGLTASASYGQKPIAANDNLTESQEAVVLHQELTDFFTKHREYYEKNMAPDKVWKLVDSFNELMVALRYQSLRLKYVFGDSRFASIQIQEKHIPLVSRRLLDHFNRLFKLAIDKGHFKVLMANIIDDDFQDKPISNTAWPTKDDLSLASQRLIFLERNAKGFFDNYRKYLVPSYMRTQLIDTSDWPIEMQEQFTAREEIVKDHYRYFFNLMIEFGEFRGQFQEFIFEHHPNEGLLKPLTENKNFQQLLKPLCVRLLKQ